MTERDDYIRAYFTANEREEGWPRSTRFESNGTYMAGDNDGGDNIDIIMG